MTSIELFLNQTQQVGPLQIWPIRWNGLSKIDYQVPPSIKQLIFHEYDEGGGPEIGRIEVFNPTSVAVLIPIGWVIGGDLLQVRTFDSSELVAPMSSVVANVSCVERGRWGQGNTEVDGGRAPLSVQVAGRVFVSDKRIWNIDLATRQQKVWRQVTNLENRTGTRPTNSLKQIMEEDSRTCNISQSLDFEIGSSLQLLRGQNALLIAFEGEPLFLEGFSNYRALRKIIRASLNSISFDLDHLEYSPTSKEKVKDFVEMATLNKLVITQKSGSSMRLRGGDEKVDTNAISDANGGLLHITALNREHRILQEV